MGQVGRKLKRRMTSRKGPFVILESSSISPLLRSLCSIHHRHLPVLAPNKSQVSTSLHSHCPHPRSSPSLFFDYGNRHTCLFPYCPFLTLSLPSNLSKTQPNQVSDLLNISQWLTLGLVMKPKLVIMPGSSSWPVSSPSRLPRAHSVLAILTSFLSLHHAKLTPTFGLLYLLFLLPVVCMAVHWRRAAFSDPFSMSPRSLTLRLIILLMFSTTLQIFVHFFLSAL